jgi:hypothetical protein
MISSRLRSDGTSYKSQTNSNWISRSFRFNDSLESLFSKLYFWNKISDVLLKDFIEGEGFVIRKGEHLTNSKSSNDNFIIFNWVETILVKLSKVRHNPDIHPTKMKVEAFQIFCLKREKWVIIFAGQNQKIFNNLEY